MIIMDKMTGEITVKTYSSLGECDVDEILRYASAKGADGSIRELAQRCIGELDKRLSFSVCYKEYGICREETAYDLGFCRIASKDLDKNLAGCNAVILFAATLGIEADRLIARHSKESAAKGLMTDAVCTERIERLCDVFEREITDGLESRPRYSPGYGDVPIELQKSIFRALDLERRLGITLNGSMLVSPTKTVTALIGIKRRYNK